MGDTGAVAATERVATAVSALADVSFAELEEPETSRVHAAVRKAQDALGIIAANVLAQVEADGRWSTSATGRGARDFDEWVAKETGSSRAGARRQTRLARVVYDESVPALAAAVAAGHVTLEHADAMTRLGPSTPARREALAGPDPRLNAARLLRRAAELGLDDFTNELKRWAATVDPTADDKGHRDATARVSCTLTARDDGVALHAFMTAVDGAAFEAALVAVAGVPPGDDARTQTQRTGAALGEMARLVLDQGLAATRSGGFRPHMTIQVSYETLLAHVRGAQDISGFPSIPAGFDPATLADGTPIPSSVLARLACDAEVSRVVFGPASQVLDVGRDERLYTGPMRRAVIARDGHCAYPGCDRPPRFGEVHHVEQPVAHSGTTSVENGVLLRWHHHDVVHSQRLTIRRDVGQRRWEFCRRDGTPIPRRVGALGLGERGPAHGRPHSAPSATPSTTAPACAPLAEPEPDRALAREESRAAPEAARHAGADPCADPQLWGD